MSQMTYNTKLHHLRFANAMDLDSIVSYLRNRWDPNHIYVKNIDLFEFYHLHGEEIDFVLAFNLDSSELDGILGFHRYTKKYKNSDLFTVLWMVKQGNGDPFLGIQLLNFLKDASECRTISTVGANPVTLPIYKRLGYRTGHLDHYIKINPKIKLTVPTLSKNFKFVQSSSSEVWELQKFSSMDALKQKFSFDEYVHCYPFKDEWYIDRMYFSHPVYQYEVWGIKKKSEIHSILVTRSLSLNSQKVIRIVDVIGDELDFAGIGHALDRLLAEERYEYIDCYCLGIEPEIFEKSGFSLKDEDSIVPNYFEPFRNENVSLNYFTSSQEKFFMFKGDGDQDRPNEVKDVVE